MNVFGQPDSVQGPTCGIVLLLLYLAFDSFTSQWQTRMFQLNKHLSPLQMMVIMNAFSSVFSFVTLLQRDELLPSLNFMLGHYWMVAHLLLFCLVATIGQLFIFYTVKHFGAVVFSIIMSFRVLFSTLLSCFVYSHPITEMGFLGLFCFVFIFSLSFIEFVGMLLVFGAMFYRIKRKTDGGELLKWRENEQARVIFHEWHEHVDI